MGKQDEIRKRLREFAGEVGPQQTMLAIVKDVDEAEFTCTLKDEDDGFEYPGIRLRPVLDGMEGLTLFPQVGTWAFAIRIEEDDDWMLLAVGQVQKWRLTIGDTVLEQTGSGLLVSRDNTTLKNALINIIEAVQKIIVLQGNNPDYNKLTAAKSAINLLLR